jgi:MFS family permease
MAFAVILASAFGTSLVYSVVQPILPILAAHFGPAHGRHIAQLAATVPSMGMLLGSLAGGWLVANLGKRVIILAAVALMGVFGTAEAFIASPALFLAARAALGLSASLQGVACGVLLTDLYEDEARTKAAGLRSGVATFGAVPSVLVVGVIASLVGWRVPFGLFAIYGLVVFPLALASITGKLAAGADRKAANRGLAQAFPPARLWPFYLLIFLLSVLNIMGVTQLPFLLKEQGVSGAAVQGMIVASDALVMGVGAVLAAPVQKRFGDRMTVIGCVVLAGLFDLVIGLSHNVVLTAVASVLSYLGLGVLLTMAFILIADRASVEERPAALGYIGVAGFLGQFANPLILAPVTAMIGISGGYFVVGAIAVAAPLVALFARRRPIPGPA